MSALVKNARALLHRVLRERTAGLRQRVRALGGVDITLCIHRDAFAGGSLIDAIWPLERRDERRNAVFIQRTDAHAVSPVRVIQRARLGIDRVKRVVFDEEAADASVGVPGLEVLALKVEDLEPVVAAIGYPETTLAVDHHRVRRPELAVTHAQRAPDRKSVV